MCCLMLYLCGSVIIFCLTQTLETLEESRFNVTQWWTDNTDFDHHIAHLRFKNKTRDNGDHAYAPSKMSVPDFYIPANSDIDDVWELREASGDLPQSSTKSLLNTLDNYFSFVRSFRGDRDNYQQLKQHLKDRFISLGLNTALQSFWPPEVEPHTKGDKAHNIIGVWPSPNRGTKHDEIIIIGAHYDSVPSSPGVDDNGSGCAAVIEIAKVITQFKCKFEKTIMFVLFDMEENQLKGSKHFIKDYLIPVEIKENGAHVIGAIVFDMILEYNSTVGSQSLGNFQKVLPKWAQKVRANQYRGNFAAVWTRRNIDVRLYRALKKNWINKNKYKLFVMDPPLPKRGSQLDNTQIEKYSTFLRSDHSSFWYPTQKELTFSSILVTDLGPWRKSINTRYHRPTDDIRILNESNLLFLKNTVDSVVKALLDLGNGKCNSL